MLLPNDGRVGPSGYRAGRSVPSVTLRRSGPSVALAGWATPEGGQEERMTGLAMTRRRLLTALLLAPPALAACSSPRSAQAEAPDPLVALADGGARRRGACRGRASPLRRTSPGASRRCVTRVPRTPRRWRRRWRNRRRRRRERRPRPSPQPRRARPGHACGTAHGGGRGGRRGGEGRDDGGRAPGRARRVGSRVLLGVRGGVGVTG